MKNQKPMNQGMDMVELNLFERRMRAICDEMGLTLRRAAISTNIKNRLDFSTAIFDAGGRLIAQADHMPVHLGSMAFAMADIVAHCDWAPGDTLVLNDPYLGGTHLPDVTVITPVFVGNLLSAFVANRAHHARIGTAQPGGMPLSTSITEEGTLISPTLLLRRGELQTNLMAILAGVSEEDAHPQAGHPDTADFFAQIAANNVGRAVLSERIEELGTAAMEARVQALNAYAARLARATLRTIPDGSYAYEDWMDDDGFDPSPIPIRVLLTADDGRLSVDFSGTSDQVRGNLNCPLPVAAAGVFYVVRCLLPADAPACAGLFDSVAIRAPAGCLIHAQSPAAVAAGNVETSMRIVDVLLGALVRALPTRIPAAAQGTMNNVAMGAREPGHSWDYYETVAGGLGGHAGGRGLSAVQAHMTNTLNTPIESLENHYPLRINRYARRRHSGGRGRWPGGDGVIREYEFLERTEVSILSDRRTRPPWGLVGGAPGAPGRNLLNGKPLPSKTMFTAAPGNLLRIETPGGGGYGEP